jgi:predicted ATPase
LGQTIAVQSCREPKELEKRTIKIDDSQRAVTEMRRALEAYIGQGNKLWAPLFQGRLAELEARGDTSDGPLRRVDEALALANATGEHWTDALLDRIRGAILLRGEPANTAPAEDAFRAGVAIAQAQKGRSFELQAALALARLYQSAARPTEMLSVLAPALEGFASTPKMPEIADARTLLDQVKGNLGAEMGR